MRFHFHLHETQETEHADAYGEPITQVRINFQLAGIASKHLTAMIDKVGFKIRVISG
jgi:hypothetical protein